MPHVLITYLDRVNISTAAPEISKEFGFDKITNGHHFQRLCVGLCPLSGSRRLAQRPVRRPAGLGDDRCVLVRHDRSDRGSDRGILVVVLRFLFGIGEAGAFSGAPPARCSSGTRGRSAALCKGSPTAQAGSEPPSRRRSWS